MSMSFGPIVLAAAGPDATKPVPGQQIWQMFPILLMLFAFYFVFMRPQQKRAKQHTEMLKTIKSGDKVATSSGIIGVVVTVKERTVSLRSEETKLEVLKSAISEILERKGDVAEAKA